MLSVKQLTRRFDGFTAVDNVSFTIEKGAIVGLLGHNGAGKTTVMKMISGFLEPSAGSITLNGEDLLDDPKKIHRVLGYLPENSPLYPELKVYEYLDFIASTRGIEKSLRPAQVKQALIATDLTERAFSKIQDLSRGLKQRVGVAQAILGKPDVVILDEPTNGLDPEQTQQMRDLIKKLSAHATVILSTHIMQEVEAVCDRVLILRNGELVVNDDLASLQNDSVVCLVTDANPEQLKALINDRAGIASIKELAKNPEKNPEKESAKNTFHIDINKSQLNDTAQLDEFMHKLSAAIVSGGFRLYEITSQKRNLETLFRDVNDGKEVCDAA